METKAFPPVNAIMEAARKVDYKGLYDKAIEFTIVALAFVAALATVCYQKWNDNNCSERIVAFASVAMKAVSDGIDWVRSVVIPEIKSFREEVIASYRQLVTVYGSLQAKA
jgi:hypothetical protein